MIINGVSVVEEDKSIEVFADLIKCPHCGKSSQIDIVSTHGHIDEDGTVEVEIDCDACTHDWKETVMIIRVKK
jgi:hypothetical protein